MTERSEKEELVERRSPCLLSIYKKTSIIFQDGDSDISISDMENPDEREPVL